MQHNAITMVRSREPVFPQEPIEDDRVPHFQPEDGGVGGERRPTFPPDNGGPSGRDPAPVFEPDENPVGGGSRRPVGTHLLSGDGYDAPILVGPFVAIPIMSLPVWPEERDGKGGKVRESLSTHLPGQALRFYRPQFPTERGGTGEGDEDECSLLEVA